MLETDGICEDVSDWGSDFDEDEVEDGTNKVRKLIVSKTGLLTFLFVSIL